MKTKEYVKKYQLNVDDNFNHKDFMVDFTNDFNEMLSNAKIDGDYGKFKRLVDDIKKKWSNINNKTLGQLPEKLWSYFYASVIITHKDEMFPHLKKQRNEELEVI